MNVIPEIRPSLIVWLFWSEQIVVEEQAERLDPIVLREAA